jgi:hypothetical protein
MNTDLASKTLEEDTDEIDGNQRFSEAPLEYIEGELYDFINGKYLYNISYQSAEIIDSGIYQDTNMLILRGKCYYPIEKDKYREINFPQKLEWMNTNISRYKQWGNYLIALTCENSIIVYNMISVERKDIALPKSISENFNLDFYVCNGIIIIGYTDKSEHVQGKVLVKIDIETGETNEIDAQGYVCEEFLVQSDGSIIMLTTKNQEKARKLISIRSEIETFNVIDKEGSQPSYIALKDSSVQGIFYEKEYDYILDGTELIRVKEDGTETVIAADYEDIDNKGVPHIPEGNILFLDDCVLSIDVNGETCEKYDYQMNCLGIYSWREKKNESKYLGYIFEEDTFYTFWLNDSEQILEIYRNKSE